MIACPTTMRRLFLLLCFATGLRADDVLIGPAPHWVEPVAVEVNAEAPKDDVRYGVYALLDDHQVLVSDTVIDYRRHVRKVLTSAGVQNASELSVDFDPSYQTPVLHTLELVRDGRRIDELTKAAIRVIDKEDATEDRIYDGTKSALVILDDVRPGDVIDYSWSLEGANPILAGKYAAELDLTSPTPARLIRHRLLWPESRALHVRSPIEASRGRDARAPQGFSVYLWERRDVSAIDVEDSLPEWFDPWEHVQLSEMGSWREVALWADAMFRLDARSAAAVRALAARIRAEHPTQQARITAAIRLVQDDIRYLGIELGRNSHEPHQPADVLAQRWGDCKDKALLLSALLRELGVLAYPALVSTKLRHELDARLPSPFLFDHVITQVLAGGKTYWIDATIGDQGGTLETIDTPNDERALIVRPDTASLTPILTTESASTLIEQMYTTRDYKSPVILDVVTTYRAGDADVFRASLTSDSLADLRRDHLNRYAADHPKIEAIGSPRIGDDRERNVITLRERYRLRDVWTRGAWTYTPRAIEEHLRLPSTRIRSMPLAVDFPLDLTQRIVVKLPDRLAIDGSRHEIETSSFRFESDVKTDGSSVGATYHLRALKDGVAAADVADHLSRVNDAKELLPLTIDPEADAPLVTKGRRAVERHRAAAVVIAALAGLFCGVVMWRARRHRAAAEPTVIVA
jgi:transglutaminase-like putative cysteine protease